MDGALNAGFGDQPKTVTIDCFQDTLGSYPAGAALVAVDVIRSTTTAVTAVATGRRCLPVSDVLEAQTVAQSLGGALLAGEVGGGTPDGFDLTNSPADVAARSDIGRPLVLLSSSGTKLMAAASHLSASYAACLRNYRAQVEFLVGRHPQVVLVGAATRGEFRPEDQLCCAWIAAGLVENGYEPVGDARVLIERWSKARVQAILESKSVAYLQSAGQIRDLEFIVGHVDDLGTVFQLWDGEVRESDWSGSWEDRTAMTASA